MVQGEGISYHIISTFLFILQLVVHPIEEIPFNRMSMFLDVVVMAACGSVDQMWASGSHQGACWYTW